MIVDIATFLLQDYMVKMEINSIRLDMKLVFEFTENMGLADIKSSPDANKTPKHGKVLNVIFTK